MLDDNTRLFDVMSEDMAASGYAVDEYWKRLQNGNRRLALDRLKQFRNGGFSSYEGTLKKARRFAKRFPLRAALHVEKVLKSRGYSVPDTFERDDVAGLRNWYGETIFNVLFAKDKRLWQISDSGIGNPHDVIRMGGKTYTHSFLIFFHRYLMMNDLFSLDAVNCFLEVGGSYGGQIEVLRKLHPRMKFCLVEIPPQLYVANQYLSAVFPGEVVTYEETRTLKTLSRDMFGKRSIAVIAPWQLPDVAVGTFDAFTNQRSFQEMSQDTVRSYCAHVRRTVKSAVLLFEHRHGHPLVKQPVGREDYEAYLAPEFRLTRAIEENFHEAELPSGTVCLFNDVYLFERI